MTRSYKPCSVKLGIAEVSRLCGCGRPRRPGTFFCGDECRFWAKVKKDALGCWLWTASRTKDRDKKREQLYGQFSIERDGQRITIRAHVYSYELANGPVPDGLEVCHHCDRPPCVRQDHLYAGTHRNNMEDAADRGRLHVPRPKRQEITVEEIYELRSLHAQGWAGISLAAHYGISKAQVSFLIRGLRRQFDAPLIQPTAAQRSA